MAINRGDCLLVHSDITPLLRGGATVGGIIDGLLKAIGPDGTLVLPTFNFEWCSKGEFDHSRTPSTTGLLSEVARRDSRFVRTLHPIYSFVVSGRQQDEFLSYDHPSGYGVGSGFETLHRLGGKIMVIGLSWQDSMTFVHYVEQQENVPYRYHKRFEGWYRDSTGTTTRREYFHFVRDLQAGVVTHLHDAERHFFRSGLARECDALGTRITIIEANVLYEETVKQLRLDPEFLHRSNTSAAT